jgi:DNA-nicking Smr family endonuclease
MSRRRQLSDEERALWTGYARSVTPLRPSRESDTSPRNESSRDESSNKASASPVSAAKWAPPPRSSRGVRLNPEPAATKPFPLAPLGRRLKQRVARGREPIDARIDLHGLTQLEAHAALLRFLRQARVQGARVVLIVTGKGSRRNEMDFGTERGVLKRQVPMWLSLPEFRQLIVGFEDAHVGHGGQGALYVRLRRER